jgi:hypothetical protein
MVCPSCPILQYAPSLMQLLTTRTRRLETRHFNTESCPTWIADRRANASLSFRRSAKHSTRMQQNRTLCLPDFLWSTRTAALRQKNLASDELHLKAIASIPLSG